MKKIFMTILILSVFTCSVTAQMKKLRAVALLNRLGLTINFEQYGIDTNYYYFKEISTKVDKELKSKQGNNYSCYNNSFKEKLKNAKFLYIGQYSSSSVKATGIPLFRILQENLNEIKNFLAAGGKIFFDYNSTDSRLASSLNLIGVELPVVSRGLGKFRGIINSSLKNDKIFISPNMLKNGGFGYGGWAKIGKDQRALIFAQKGKTQYGMIIQNKVLGKGTVIFSQMYPIFRKKHPNLEFRQNLLSYIFDCNIVTFKDKVDKGKGGAGKLVAYSTENYKLERKTAKPIYISNIMKRPWWNADFKFRMPLLVSETIGMPRDKAVVDIKLPLGLRPDKNSIRLISAEGVEIASQTISADDGSLELVFNTDINAYEQKPFLIYYNLPSNAAKIATKRYLTDLKSSVSEKIFKLENEKILVSFWKHSSRTGKVNRIHIKGSPVPNELTETASGGAFYGHVTANGNELSPGELIVDGPLKKSIKYTGEKYSITYSLYSFSEKIDYEIKSKGKNIISISTGWLVNGSSSLDKIYYEGANGIKQLSGEKAEILDNINFYPIYNLTKWIKKGWLGIEDSKNKITDGEFFDSSALNKCAFWGQGINGGERIDLSFSLKQPLKGALVAMRGDVHNFRKLYICWKNPPEVFLGEPQACSNIEVKVPCYRSDVIRGHMTAILSSIREGRRDDDNSASNLISTVKKWGGNSLKVAFHYSSPEQIYSHAKNNTSYLKEIVNEAHRRGVAIRCWDMRSPFFKTVCHGKPMKKGDPQKELKRYLLLAKTGVDYIMLGTGGEWHGFENYAKRKNKLEIEKSLNELTKSFAKQIKDKFPNIPLGILCTGSGSFKRYVDIESKAPFLDSLETEIVVAANPDLTSVKYGVKYPLSVFGNDGRTIEHHFYFYKPLQGYRVGEMELPLMFGIKGFCCEHLANRFTSPELIQIVTDFYNFIDHTGLENFIASSKTIDFVGVLRDRQMVVDDLLNDNCRFLPSKMSVYEAACKNVVSIKNIPVNIISNRFCTPANLERYKLVIVPENKLLSTSLAEALVKYIKAGGCLITCGKSIENPILTKVAAVKKNSEVKPFNSRIIYNRKTIDAEYRTSLQVVSSGAQVLAKDITGKPAIFVNKYGKGNIIYSPYNLFQGLSRSLAKTEFVKELILNETKKFPVVIPAEYENIVDTNLLSSGKNQYCLGVYNPGGTPLKFEITLNVPVEQNSFVLDIKASRRYKFENKIFVDIPARSVAFYLIGNAKTTNIPEVRKLEPAGGYAQKTDMRLQVAVVPVLYKSVTSGANIIGVFLPKRETWGNAGSQNYGAEGIYKCLNNEKISNYKVRYLHHIDKESLQNIQAVIVPNMGPQYPQNLSKNWDKLLRVYVEQGGNVMLIHHSIGMISPDFFTEVGLSTGMYNNAKTLEIVKEHPITKGLNPGDHFFDTCWSPFDLLPGPNGKVLVKAKCSDSDSPAVVAGKIGKGKVVLCAFGIGAGFKKSKGKYLKFEQPPQGKAKQLLLNIIEWFVS